MRFFSFISAHFAATSVDSPAVLPPSGGALSPGRSPARPPPVSRTRNPSPGVEIDGGAPRSADEELEEVGGVVGGGEVVSGRAESQLLYIVLGTVLGVVVLVTILCIALCTWRQQRRQNNAGTVGWAIFFLFNYSILSSFVTGRNIHLLLLLLLGLVARQGRRVPPAQRSVVSSGPECWYCEYSSLFVIGRRLGSAYRAQCTIKQNMRSIH